MKTENTVSDGCRLLIQDFGGQLLRNNSGAMQTPTGRWVYFGVGNDGSKASKTRRSSDLIGITPMLILPHHVGRTIGVFTAIEAKREGWVYYENDDHTQHQLKYMTGISQRGGIASFISNETQLKPFIERFIL